MISKVKLQQMPMKLTAAMFRDIIFLLAFMTSLGVSAKSFTGLIYPLHDITMSAGVSGLIMKRPVQPGQSVKAGQLLLQLDDRLQLIESNRRRAIADDESELQAARDRLRILDTLLHDTRAVYDRTGSISKDELLRLEAEQLASQGRVMQLGEQERRERLDFDAAESDRLLRQITAPINGIVTKIMPQVGEWVKSGEAVMHLVDTSTAILRVAIPHHLASQLKVGAQQLIKLEAGSSVPDVNGQIKFVSPVADPASGLVQVEISFSNPGRRIKTGVKGTVELTP
jgi:RND family efflux transporter MFP subunit